MNTKPAPSQHLFVVRLWSETAEKNQIPLRGSVEHVPSGQRLYFTSLNDLSDFIALKAMVLPQFISKEKETKP
ncbi:MAG: hypothetical protein HY869_00755 [Chloroflexi bacterium]|nr:hypothetical protein [Chloroflexota bacterium]